MADEQQAALQRAYLESMLARTPEPAASDPTKLETTDLTTADGTDTGTSA